MAYKKNGKKSRRRKTEPSELTMNYVLPAHGSDGSRRYIDLSQCASLVNRRFYRQGINWMVSGFTLHNITGTAGSCVIKKLPTTWVMGNAWEKTFRAWQHMIDNATIEAGTQSIKGRFLDFKVFADKQHHLIGSSKNLLPFVEDTTGLKVEFAPGQWQMSDITIPTRNTGAAVDFELIAVGANDPGAGASGKDAKSLIQGYADSRALPSPEDPNVPADANTNWMIGLFDDGTAQDSAVTNMLELTGDNPPYPYEGDAAGTPDTMYPGGETNAPALTWHDQINVTSTTVSNKVSSKGGAFPCGLISLHYEGTLADAILQVHLVPGPHRGFLCEPMTDM
jgi:hypothetical protein